MSTRAPQSLCTSGRHEYPEYPTSIAPKPRHTSAGTCHCCTADPRARRVACCLGVHAASHWQPITSRRQIRRSGCRWARCATRCTRCTPPRRVFPLAEGLSQCPLRLRSRWKVCLEPSAGRCSESTSRPERPGGARLCKPIHRDLSGGARLRSTLCWDSPSRREPGRCAEDKRLWRWAQL